MYLLIAIGLALTYAILTPLSQGLLDTSMWVAKILAPTDLENNATSKQFLKMGQAALMEGWLSNVPFITTILLFSSIIIGFAHSWWGGILMLFVSIILGALTQTLWTRPVSHYLLFLYHKMVNRAADYKTKNDLERLKAAESYCNDLQQIILLYHNCQLRPPTRKELNRVPCGDLYYWLKRATSQS
jgi:hypothetical protein